MKKLFNWFIRAYLTTFLFCCGIFLGIAYFQLLIEHFWIVAGFTVVTIFALVYFYEEISGPSF